MSATSPDIAAIREAIHAELEAVTGDLFDVRRGFFALPDLPKLTARLTAWVLPIALADDPEFSTRTEVAETVDVAVQLACRCNPDAAAQLDALIAVELAIKDHFAGLDDLAGHPIDAVTIGGGTGAFFDPQTLIEKRSFVAAVELTVGIR